jgi:hypothetical protein
LNCHASERKTSRLTFANLQPNDLVSLPVTSTDVGAADPAILAINLQANMPIDVQPIDPVLNSDSETMNSNPIIGGANNDFNVNSTGKRQVLALNTYKSDGTTLNVDACAFAKEKVSLTVAGSNPPAPAESGAPYLASNGTCLGQIFTFDYSNITPRIPGDDKQASCLANPTATLLVSGVPLSSEYEVVAGKKGSPKKASYTPPDSANCTSEGGVVTCQINAEVGGSQVVRCCTSCGPL